MAQSNSTVISATNRAARYARPGFLRQATTFANLCLILSLCWFSGSAYPHDPANLDSAVARHHLAAVFDRLDCEDDSVIDHHEVEDHFSLLWHPVDMDASRDVSFPEYQRAYGRYHPDTQKKLFNEADVDGNGRLSAREYSAHVRALMSLVDKDRDGEISRPDVGLRLLPSAGNNQRVAKASEGE